MERAQGSGDDEAALNSNRDGARQVISVVAHSRKPKSNSEDDMRPAEVKAAGSLKKHDDEGDERWQEPQRRWGALILERCEDFKITLSELADLLSSPGEFPKEDSLKNWVHYRSRVRWEWLAPIGRVLEIPMIEQLVLLNLVDDDSYLFTSKLLERERSENRRLRAAMFNESRGDIPSSRIARAALSTEKLDVRLRPWMEGLEPFRVRAGDFLRLQSLDEISSQTPEIEDVNFSVEGITGRIGDLLSSEGCVGTKGLSPQLKSWGAATNNAQAEGRIWYVPRLNQTKTPTLTPAAIAFNSIVVFGPHISTWGTDVASFIGGALGWGSSSTTTLTRAVYGSQIAERENQKWRAMAAERVLAESLREPEGRAAQMVFAHTVSGATQPIINHIKKDKQDPLLVFLRPTSRLLDFICKPSKKRTYVPREDLEQIINQVEEALLTSATPHLIIDVGFPNDRDPASPVNQDLRDRKLSRSMIAAALVINYLFDERIENCQIDANCPEAFARFLQKCSNTTEGHLKIPEFVPPVHFT